MQDGLTTSSRRGGGVLWAYEPLSILLSERSVSCLRIPVKMPSKVAGVRIEVRRFVNTEMALTMIAESFSYNGEFRGGKKPRQRCNRTGRYQ